MCGYMYDSSDYYDVYDSSKIEGEPEICSLCNGTGEGQNEFSTCPKCKGTGETYKEENEE